MTQPPPYRNTLLTEEQRAALRSNFIRYLFRPPEPIPEPAQWQTDAEYLQEIAQAVREHGLCDHAGRLEAIATKLADNRQRVSERDRRLVRLAFEAGRLFERKTSDDERNG